MSFLKNSRKCFEERDSSAGPKGLAEKKWTVKSIFGSMRRKIKKMKRIPEEEKNPAVGENDFTDILTYSSKEAVCGTNCQIKMSKCIIYSPLIEPEPSRVDEQGQQYVPLPGALMDEPGLNDSNTMMIKQSLKEKERGHGTNTEVIVAEMEEVTEKDKKSLKKQKAQEEKERKRGEKVEATLQRLAKSERKLDMETERRKMVKAALNARIQEEEELMQKIQGKIDDFDARIDKKVEKIDAMKAQRKAEKDKPLSWKLDMDFHIKKSLLRRRELCGERNKLCSSKKNIEKRIEKYDFKIGSIHILSDENRKPKLVPPCFFADSLISPKENKQTELDIDCGKPGPSGFQNKAFQRYLRASRQKDDAHSSKDSLNSRVSNEEKYESEGKGKDKQDGVLVQKMLTDPVSGSVKNESLYSTQNKEKLKIEREKDEEKHEKRLEKSEKILDKETERRKKVKAALNARIEEDKELIQKIQGEIDDLNAKINKKVEKIDAMKARRKAEMDKPLSWKLDMDFHIKKSLLRRRELCGECNKLCSSKKKIEKRMKGYDHRSRSVRILSEENRKPKPVPPCFFADGLIPPKENEQAELDTDHENLGPSGFLSEIPSCFQAER